MLHDHVRLTLNLMTRQFAANQARVAELERDFGRPLTVTESFNLYNCTLCGEGTGNCTHGE